MRLGSEWRAAGSTLLSRRANRTAVAFAAVIVFAELSPAIPHHPPPRVGWWIAGVAVTVVAGAVSAIGRGRVPLLRYVPLLLFAAAVQMLRAADGNGAAGFVPLLILPVIWYALYGNRVGVLVALVAVAAVNLGPLILVGPPEYPVTLWRASVLWVVILALCGLVAERLVAAIRAKSAALSASEARFRTAFADAPTGVAIIGAAGQQIGMFQQVNRALAAMLGRTEDEMVGRSILDFTHPADRSVTEQALLTPEERQVAQTIEKRYLHSSGRAVPVTITYSRIQSQAGLEPRLIAHIVDTTERRAAQLEMLNALEQEKQANARLRRAEQTRADLLATATHELYEPLAAIKDTLTTLPSTAEHALTAAHIADLRDIEQRIVQLLGIVDELSNIPRLPDDGDWTPEPVDMAAVVQAAIDSIRPIAQSHELALQTDLNLEGAQVSGQAVNIERVLINLLDNAVKFTPPGGAVDAQARVRDDAVIIDVTDTGIGIRPEEQGRVFDQFYRAPEATERAIPGAGLGLAIAKAITDQHHGAIKVFSEPGVGSTFTLILPLRQPH
jgi:PAS domain S-box-containing protein